MTNETGNNGQLISLLLQLHLDTQIICIIVVLKVLMVDLVDSLLYERELRYKLFTFIRCSSH